MPARRSSRSARLRERTIRLSARYGLELEFTAVHRIADHLVASAILPDLAIDYARRAEAMLQPSDPVSLRAAVLKNLATALRRTGNTQEAKAVDDRLSELDDSAQSRQGSIAATVGPEASRNPRPATRSPPAMSNPVAAMDREFPLNRPVPIGRAGASQIFAFVNQAGREEDSFQAVLAINVQDGTWVKATDDGLARIMSRLSRDGKFLTYTGLEPAGVFRCGILGGPATRITHGQGVPLWSPDGKRILVSEVQTPLPEARASYRWTTWCYQADGSGRAPLPLAETGQVLDWSADGTWLVTASGAMDRITLVHPDGTGARELKAPGLKLFPRFSPDGKRLSYISARSLGDEERSLWVADTVLLAPRLIFKATSTGLGGRTCWSPDGKRIVAVLHDWKPSGDGGYEHANSRIEILDAGGENRHRLHLPAWQLDIVDWR